MNDYELLDFGEGRRLERFGTRIVDRPCPVAENLRKNAPELWAKAVFQFIADHKRSDAERGQWLPSIPESWTVNFGQIRFELRGTPFGHLGIFPEQQKNWRRIFVLLKNMPVEERRKLRVLNLFAYTGGSSIAAALAGPEMEVVHVDSSRSVVDWAKRNAELSGVGDRIRFIVEDARKFVRREAKRRHFYDAVVLDPPSYGHGVRGEAWKISEHLPQLLTDIVAILAGRPVLFLLTTHSPGIDSVRLKTMLSASGFSREVEAISMALPCKTARNPGQRLPSGCGVLWTCESGMQRVE